MHLPEQVFSSPPPGTVRALVVVEAHPVINDPTGVLQVLKTMTVCALLPECPDHPPGHPDKPKKGDQLYGIVPVMINGPLQGSVY